MTSLWVQIGGDPLEEVRAIGVLHFVFETSFDFCLNTPDEERS
jgi:hypothetical protein